MRVNECVKLHMWLKPICIYHQAWFQYCSDKVLNHGDDV